MNLLSISDRLLLF